ncbi:MAG: DUF2283 domain-containing protein [Nitrososphaeria archaeon]
MQKLFRKVEYSPDADAIVVTLNDSPPKYGESFGDNIIIHFDEKGQPVEIEILNASEFVLSSMEAITTKAKEKAIDREGEKNTML